MLVLTRKIDQEIVINGPATVTILEVFRNRVKIGIVASKDVTILRGELVSKEVPDHTHTHNGTLVCDDYDACNLCHCHYQDEDHTICCKGDAARELYQRHKEATQGRPPVIHYEHQGAGN